MRWTWTLAALSAALIGVGLVLRRNPAEKLPLPPAHSPRDVLPMLAELGYPPTDGNAFELAQNGKVFDVLEESIRDAKQSVHILVFIWRACPASNRVTRAVLQRAKQGVKCRVVVDPLASPGFQEHVMPELQKAGCEVQLYKDLQQSVAQGEEGVERTHRKIVVVDGKVGITGGFGIWKSWEGDGLEKEEWRDTNVRVRGPVVAEMQHAFEETWTAAGGQPLPRTEYPDLPPAGDSPATFVASRAKIGEHDPHKQTSGEKMAEILIQSARKRLWIANSYFVPTDRMLQMLVRKAEEGVDVRVLAPGPVHDWKTVRAAQRAGYRHLKKAGIHIYEYQPSMMHAKVWLVDEKLVSIGSMNLDPLSLKQLEEGQLVMEDAALARQVEADLLKDFQHSKEKSREWAGPIELFSRGLLWVIGRI